MAKVYKWEYTEKGENGAEDILHTVSLKCSKITGKAIITIDGTQFDISVRPFGLSGTSQMFRLGEMAAMLEFPKSGAPTVTVDGEKL